MANVTFKNITLSKVTAVVVVDPEKQLQRVVNFAVAESVVVDSVLVSYSGDLYQQVASKKLAVTAGSMPARAYTAANSAISNEEPESGAVLGQLNAHEAATTGTHGVAGGTIAKVADIADNTKLSVSAQAAITASHALYADLVKIVAYESAVSIGGGATETLTVTGLLGTDTILSVVNSTVGATPANSVVAGYGAPGADSLSVTWIGDPGAGAKVTVLVKKV